MGGGASVPSEVQWWEERQRSLVGGPRDWRRRRGHRRGRGRPWHRRRAPAAPTRPAGAGRPQRCRRRCRRRPPPQRPRREASRVRPGPAPAPPGCLESHPHRPKREGTAVEKGRERVVGSTGKGGGGRGGGAHWSSAQSAGTGRYGSACATLPWTWAGGGEERTGAGEGSEEGPLLSREPERGAVVALALTVGGEGGRVARAARPVAVGEPEHDDHHVRGLGHRHLWHLRETRKNGQPRKERRAATRERVAQRGSDGPERRVEHGCTEPVQPREARAAGHPTALSPQAATPVTRPTASPKPEASSDSTSQPRAKSGSGAQ